MNWSEMPYMERKRFIVEHAHRIFVRAEIDGRWQSVSILELPESKAWDEINRLAKRDVPPVMLKEDQP